MSDTIVDMKFIFTGVNPCTKRIVTQDNALVFKASDNAIVETLRFYHDECRRKGCGDKQLEGVARMIQRVVRWRSENPGLCKIADTTACEAEHTIGGKPYR